MSDASRTPMKLLKALSPEAARIHLDHKAAVTENANLSTLPVKTKLLAGIGVAAALQSRVCTLEHPGPALGPGGQSRT